MPKTLEDLVKSLDAYPWWQLKHHKIKGAAVHTCTIQSVKGKSIYHSACSAVSATIAVEEALDVAAKE